MRYELSDFEWTTIRPFLPNKPRGVPRVNDRRVLNGIFWILRSGAPWRDLPESFGPYTTCYNRFVRWRMAGIWDLIIEALAETHDGSVQMIDTSVVRVHQHGGCAGGGEIRPMGRSRGGLTPTADVSAAKLECESFKPQILQGCRKFSGCFQTAGQSPISASSPPPLACCGETACQNI
jgi:transposase